MPICAIVGAGPRMGNGLAQSFALAGHDIVLISRNTATTEGIAADLRKKGVQAHQIAFDATDRAATIEGFSRIELEVGLSDVVIYNPANMVMAAYSEVTPDDMEKTWSIMLYAAMNVVAAALPAMKRRGSGTLLFTGGGFGIEPSVPRAPHSIAKAAIRNYAHGLYLELKDQGIHAGTVTVHRPIQAGEDMVKCASTFVAMHQEPADGWTWEQHYGK
ncbi:MAG: SDR family NAD(P)-dependent oxidoreductase [Spirochaetaceae bacterium]|nr:SDR family NAD(P)-dependent oxidoreductase [Spirochaetaceae bacterium]